MASSSSLCSIVSNIFLGISIDGISLYKISWNIPPSGTQSICVQYKVTGDPTWINSSTNLSVDIYGNIIGSSFLVIDQPTHGTSYDIQAFNQCGSIAFQTTYTFPIQVYSGNYLLDNAIYNICGNNGTLLYLDSLFGVGAFMFTDMEMTTPLTGYTYIANVNNGAIYAINSGTGEVGAITAYACRQDTTNTVILGNNTGTICSGTITSVYSDGEAVVGSVLYIDLALSVPVTGYDYVLFLNENIIYNLNNSTGVIGSDTGLSCTANGNDYQYSVVYDDINDATLVKLYTNGSFGKNAIMYTDYAMITELTGYNFILFDSIIRVIDSTTGVVGCIAENC